MVYEAFVAPEITSVPFSHRYPVAFALAVTLNVTLLPMHRVWLGVGCVMIEGSTLFNVITADPFILLVQPLVVFIATMVYVPAVWYPKSIEFPFPLIADPSFVLPFKTN